MNTGIRRRARLLGEALRPPRPATLGGQQPQSQQAEKPQQAKPAKPTKPTKPAAPTKSASPAKQAEPAEPVQQPQQEQRAQQDRRPEKKTTAVTYTVPTAARLVESPVFVLAPVRSGSTLLRMLLNSHSRMRAPHELHLRTLGVDLTPGFSDRSMRQIDLDQAELEHVLWDRVLSLELERSGKEVIVDKTPGNVWTWERLRYAWPKARFIVLLRHPAGIVASLANRRSNTGSWRQLESNVLKYLQPLEEARQTLGCLTVRYEELTADPERVTRDICAYLGQEWEPEMLDYGEHDHGPFVPNLGDRSSKIRSGQIVPPAPPEGAERLSPRLREFAEAWGYDEGDGGDEGG